MCDSAEGLACWCCQVHGLHSEYERLRLEHEDGQNGLKVADKDQAAKQKASLQAAHKQNEELQVCGTVRM